MDSKQVSKMKSFDIKLEKTNAILKYKRLHTITTLFRFMEMIVFLVMISSQLPFSFSVKVFEDYFRGITFSAFSPKLVFLIGNVIILILFLKSRASENNDGDKIEDLCYEYVNSCERNVVNSTTVTVLPPPPPPPSPTPTTTTAAAVIIPSNRRKISRCRSENPIRVECKENQTHRELRRSATEMSRSKNFDRAAEREKSYLEDELSCEDFRRTVEAFIARQQKILRDEEFSPMVYIES
ncbi:hypothetical protein Lser_V15G45732 [Lactuca serriola]